MDAFLEQYGPFAVFFLIMLSGIGLPLGEDIITIPAGALIANGRFPLWTTLILAYVAVVVSDCTWFLICSRLGTPLLHKRWFKRMVHPRRLLQAKHQLEVRGVWLVVMSRFIPSSRTTTITVSGLLHMPFWQFGLATASCALLSTPMQIGIGYLIGRGIATENTGHLMIRIVGVIAVIIAITVIGGWLMRRRASGRSPRAKAAWLRRFRVPRLGRKSKRKDVGAGDAIAPP